MNNTVKNDFLDWLHLTGVVDESVKFSRDLPHQKSLTSADFR